MDVNTAIDRYDELAEQVFSEIKRFGDGKFKATNLEKAIKSVVKDVTGNSETPLLEEDQNELCRT